MKSLVAGLLGGALALVAGGAQEPRTRDSAGARIVGNPAKASAPVRFAIGSAPIMDVGGLDDSPTNEFNHRQGYLRGVLLSNGGLVVTDVNRLHFFDPKGKRVAIVGRDGDGPGEYRYITAICRTRGDTLVISDNRTSRLTVLDGRGLFVRNIPQPIRASLPFDGCLGDGTFVLQKLLTVPNQPMAVAVTRHQLDGRLVDSIGVFKFGNLDMATGREWQLVAAGQSIYYADGFGDVLAFRGTPGRPFSDGYGEIRGTALSIIRTADKPTEIPMEEREKQWAATIPRDTPPEAVKQRMDRMRSMPADKHWPAHRRVHVDADGRLWVQDFYRVPRGEHGWTAFDPSGRMLGRLIIPAQTKRFEIVGFGKNQVLVARADEDDALHMTVYSITSVGR